MVLKIIILYDFHNFEAVMLNTTWLIPLQRCATSDIYAHGGAVDDPSLVFRSICTNWRPKSENR
jgi:hypothetical protein